MFSFLCHLCSQKNRNFFEQKKWFEDVTLGNRDDHLSYIFFNILYMKVNGGLIDNENYR